ncbi:hypothetical protein PR048_010247 [Dryococelus australis]|uniref:Uncharacterized protein n=1 Tax=Dryococelus australis TaxID=614101 RepID=A0ABQ9I474_9NEOP|nr:hypothetical protein PR048_010247 [Dryococelus australis]
MPHTPNRSWMWWRSGWSTRLPYRRIGFDSPFGVAPGFTHVGIVPDDAAGRRFFSGISLFPLTSIQPLLHIHFSSPSSGVNNAISGDARNLFTHRPTILPTIGGWASRRQHRGHLRRSKLLREEEIEEGNGKEPAMVFVKHPSRHSTGETSGNHRKPKSGWLDQESNPGPPECESRSENCHPVGYCKDQRTAIQLDNEQFERKNTTQRMVRKQTATECGKRKENVHRVCISSVARNENKELSSPLMRWERESGKGGGWWWGLGGQASRLVSGLRFCRVVLCLSGLCDSRQTRGDQLSWSNTEWLVIYPKQLMQVRVRFAIPPWIGLQFPELIERAWVVTSRSWSPASRDLHGSAGPSVEVNSVRLATVQLLSRTCVGCDVTSRSWSPAS